MAEAGSAGPPVGRTIDQWLAEAAAHETAGRLDDAERILAEVITARPDYPPGLHQGALMSYKRKRPREAIDRLERAIRLAPGHAIFHRNICELYRSQSRLDEALFHGRRAVELAPNDPGANYNLGVIQYDRLETDEAIACARRAIALDPSMAGAHFELAEALLLTGHFEEGWREYEWRFDLPGVARPLPPNDRPLWDGTPMPDGVLMLIGDQGFGDTIQFCRYIPQVAQLCPNLIMACSSEMRPIVMQQAGITRYFDRWEHMPAFDAYCPLSGLPRLFGADLRNIPAEAPYVRAEPDRAAYWRNRIDALVPDGYRRIGLVWAGRPTHGNDHHRSMALRDLAALGDLKRVALVALQMGPAQAQVGGYYGAAPLINLGAEIKDYADTMAILDGLDRLVTVDTSVGHLAGAMGRPVSMLLPFAPDWRWLLGRIDSPWYPSLTLHRQDAPGQWSGAIAKAIQAVTA